MNKVVDLWRPETIRATVNGQTTEPFGPKPTGLLCFHESMRFVELISDPVVARYASGNRERGTAKEDKAAVIGNLALFGTYTVDHDGNFSGNTVEGCTFPELDWRPSDSRSAQGDC